GDRTADATYQVRCDYLIGADGGRSRVVEQAGIPIEGEAGLAAAVNVWFEADLARYLAHRPGVVYWHAAPGTPFLTGAGTLICHRPWDEFVMVCSYDPATETIPHSEEFAVERIRQIVGDPTIVPVIKGFSTWTINHQVASHYQAGRVLAMGDAVHRHPPTGSDSTRPSPTPSISPGSWPWWSGVRPARPCSRATAPSASRSDARWWTGQCTARWR